MFRTTRTLLPHGSGNFPWRTIACTDGDGHCCQPYSPELFKAANSGKGLAYPNTVRFAKGKLVNKLMQS